MPLLAFGVTKKFSFLAEKATGAMFNLAIKLSVISFLTGALVPMLNNNRAQLNKVSGYSNLVTTWTDIGKAAMEGGASAGLKEYAVATFTNMSVIIQLVLMCVVMLLLTKKIPSLVQGLLSGQPQLGGSNMTQMATSAARTAAHTAASAASGKEGDKKQHSRQKCQFSFHGSPPYLMDFVLASILQRMLNCVKSVTERACCFPVPQEKGNHPKKERNTTKRGVRESPERPVPRAFYESINSLRSRSAQMTQRVAAQSS